MPCFLKLWHQFEIFYLTVFSCLTFIFLLSRRSCFVENMWNYLSFDRFEEESGRSFWSISWNYVLCPQLLQDRYLLSFLPCLSGLQSILIALKASQELRFLNHDFLAGVREIICVNSLLSYKCTRCWFHNHFMVIPRWVDDELCSRCWMCL